MSLLKPDLLCDRTAVLSQPCPVPATAGVYAWYFDQPPPSVPVDGCIHYRGRWLLYVGISPKSPPGNGKPPSRQTLRHRIRYHYRGNAEGSTLRLTLGCLLADQLGIELRRVGSGTRMTLGPGEAKLSEWMEQHAFVTWIEHPEPWVHEAELIGSVSLPLNLAGNSDHPYWEQLRKVRAAAKAKAQSLPTLE